MAKLNSPNRPSINEVVRQLRKEAGQYADNVLGLHRPKVDRKDDGTFYLTDPSEVVLEGKPEQCPHCNWYDIKLCQGPNWRYFFKCQCCGATAGYVTDPQKALWMWNRRGGEPHSYVSTGSPFKGCLFFSINL